MPRTNHPHPDFDDIWYPSRRQKLVAIVVAFLIIAGVALYIARAL